MLKALAFGFGAGAAIQSWRAWPPQSIVTANSLAVVFCAGLVVAYFAGKLAARGASASATATATAVSSSSASNQVNVALIVPGNSGAGVQGSHGVRVPSSSASWIGPPVPPALTADQLEGLDLSEFARDPDTEVLER